MPVRYPESRDLRRPATRLVPCDRVCFARRACPRDIRQCPRQTVADSATMLRLTEPRATAGNARRRAMPEELRYAQCQSLPPSCLVLYWVLIAAGPRPAPIAVGTAPRPVASETRNQ